jgi:glycosyltransferase involved in cell wall biosynthesis
VTPRASRPTRVLLDATSLGDDSAYRGIGSYVRHLLDGLSAQPGFEVTALCRRGTQLPPGVRRARAHRVAPGRFRPLEHELLLPLDLLRAADVVHSPALAPPWRSRHPWVQTLHDVIPLVLADPELEVERQRWRRHAPRLRRASRIIAVSRHSADVGIRVLGLDPSRVEVIHHGVDPRFQPPSQARAREPRLLLVSEYSRRKGYPEAMALIGRLKEAGYPHRLRITGRIAPWVRPALDALLSSAPAPDRVELAGFVEDLVAEYQRAQVLVISSRYEGFGFPAIEAMACGTPVVAFDNSALPEVLGDAGLLVPDGDVAALTRAARSLLDDGERWAELSARGLERVRSFTWASSVEAHRAVLAAAARD